MAQILEIYQASRSGLERELLGAKDVVAAAECMAAKLEQVRLEALGAYDARMRREINRLFESARPALKCMLAVTDAELSVVKEKQIAYTPQEKLGMALPPLAIAVGAVLTVWLILAEMNEPAALAAVLTALAWLSAQSVLRKAVALRARPRVNVQEAMRLMDRLVSSLNEAAEAAENEKPAAVQAGNAPVPAEIYEPVQMLLEAVNTGDGAYALKAAPGLMNALMQQGIEAVNYTPDTADMFDLFPGTEEGFTIRPALVKEGRVISRGQATSRE